MSYEDERDAVLALPDHLRDALWKIEMAQLKAMEAPMAIVGGMGKLNDPWGDLVNWAREFSVVSVKYRLFADAAVWLGEPVAGDAADRGALATT